MKQVIWIRIPGHVSQEKMLEFKMYLKNAIGQDNDQFMALLTSGEVDIKVFGGVLYTMPFWVLKIKKFFRIKW